MGDVTRLDKARILPPPASSIRSWYDEQDPTSGYVPLSVRHGNRRKRLGWKVKSARTAVALWLAPWLRTWP